MSYKAREEHLPDRWKALFGVRRVARLGLGLAVLATLARLVQLAAGPGAPLADDGPTLTFHQSALGNSSAKAIGAGAERNDAPYADAELARMYSQCPTAGLISLAEVATAPQRVDAILPPFRATVTRAGAELPPSGGVAGAHATEIGSARAGTPRLAADSGMAGSRVPLPAAVPRVRYPVTLQKPISRLIASPSDTVRGAEVIRVAQIPRVGAASPAVESDWLVDPNEWYTPEEQASRSGESPLSSPSADSSARPAETSGPEFSDEPSQRDPPDFEPAPLELNGNEPAVETSEPETPSSPWAPPVETESVPALPAATQPGAVDSTTNAPVANEIFPAPTEHGGASHSLNGEGNPGGSHSIDPGHTTAAPQKEECADDPHLELFAKNNYPSARECATCHEEIYEQWSVSAHAYAAVSPMFHKFEQKLNDLSHGTVGYFCMRCHAPVATDLYASRAEPLWNLPEVAREGITCIACHRVKYAYGKSNGERRIEPGDVFAPVYGGIGGEGVADAIARKEEFKVKTSPDEKGPGQNIHLEGIYFDPLTRSEACTPCHQVAVHPGIKLEVVWEQYRASPACKKGIQCQDCHMGRVPGLPLGYEIGAVAKVNGKTVNDQRKKSNHMFHGPNYSIAHPGVFPFHLKANRWTMEEWLMFDWRAGWGTEEFEDRVADGEITADFPPCWAEADDRYDARDILDDNFKKLDLKRENRRQVMENGSRVEGPFFDGTLRRGEDVKFHYIVTNSNEGHNLLTASLGAQPQLWANIVLVGPNGQRLWETGYTDSYGDLANIHSEDVRHGRVPFDWQLFNLQTMFLITGAKGTDREFFIPVNVDIDQLPFIRPGAQPISVINHPPFIRMESQSLAPLGSRKVPFRIPGELVRQPGKYRLSFRMRSRAEPLYFMRFCDATPEMQRMMNEWMIDLHPMSVEFCVE